MTMNQSRAFDPATLIRAFAALIAAAAVAFSLAAPSEAQRSRGNQNQEEEQVNRQLSTQIGERVLAAQDMMGEDRFNEVIQSMTQLLQREMTPYERSIVLRLRAAAYFETDNIPGTINDFNAALATNALVRDEIIALRTNLGQLNLSTDNIAEGIRQFELALAAGAELNPRLAKMLAQAYIQAERFRDGLQYAEYFYNNTPNKTEGDYSILQYYYNQLERPQDELRVVREQLNAFPGSRRSWQNLIALFAQLDREQDAFEANKMMYLNGLFEQENELTRLVSYYSFFSNPFRGASILEREMNAGRVSRNQRNLELLANMWRQAAEFRRAVPVLEQLSEVMGDGETALKLAEAHFQLNDPARAEAALEVALQRGGLSNTGAAWELLGNARYQQNKNQQALAAFREAARFPRTRSSANGWIRFINAQIEGVERRARQREQVLIDECRLTLEAERRSLVLIGDVDDDGRVRFSEIPQRCEPYFNLFGEQIREAGMTDEEFEAARAEREAQAEARRRAAEG